MEEERKDVDGQWDEMKEREQESRTPPPCWFWVFILPWSDAQQSDKGLFGQWKKRSDPEEQIATDSVDATEPSKEEPKKSW
eukprot:CAMPEP_0118934910 /NCGR_PEP_ID=MMETSP1169-20130426/14470_1 /TAXON_ID=36882 /ORGANISM="Pyramimonas obovata, Strain CCMP722" /LENGTH=80 /DNA_ID=CAMNT_0006877871 /DNA_START=320 /DNA_END=559 /DNA_ORIENTATION=-